MKKYIKKGYNRSVITKTRQRKAQIKAQNRPEVQEKRREKRKLQYPPTKGKRWKVKDTSKMGKHRIGKPAPNKGKKMNYKYSDRTQQLEKTAGRKKPDQCEVCGVVEKKICFDHNHETKEFRGWICHRCNVALGMVDDKIEILKLLIKYLKKHE